MTVVAVVAGLVTAVGIVTGSSYSVFSGVTDNSGNNWAAGNVVLTDDDAGSAMFVTSGAGANQVNAGVLKPGQTVVNCIRVTYAGSLPSTVRLYASATGDTPGPGGTGLRDYLHVKIEEGTAGAFGCSGFGGTVTTLWDSTTHPNAASDLLTVFPSGYATGIVSALASWSGTAARTYRFTVTVDSSIPDTSQSSAASATFTWEARNI
ncbi:hypothetical protein Aab01nite_62790 [Paractinoplanes abujensis]|uniref:Uncharacterized protein n=1 Tax=Paractinoplanes abujensis TaxID=882441 RepID=A0A7W7G1K5_9ACTN|nr:hypothetical protein [Actinoplanes abujensis]MBB4692812.1 hypothetical protein [Actinoplanes abujensis]GID22689.1 hypothetical protein Aab01nite_62790 [Actinoplanes abujensis]